MAGGAVVVGPVTVSKPVPVPVPGAVVAGAVGLVTDVSGGSGPVTGGGTTVAPPVGAVAVVADDPAGLEPSSSLATA